MMIALMTNKNKPKVRIVMGMVSMIRSGFKMALNNPNTAATTMAVKKLFTYTPGKI